MDALSALLMVVIFVLMVFIFAHFMLSQILSGQESELASLNSRVIELTEMLGLEQTRNRELDATVIELSGLVDGLTEEKAELSGKIEKLGIRTEQDQAKIKRQLLLAGSLQEDIDALRRLREELEERVGALAAAIKAEKAESAAERDRSRALEARLDDQKERTLLAQSEIEEKDIRIQALAAVVGNQKQAIAEEKQLSASARAEVALLNQRVNNLRRQLEEISRALDYAEQQKQTQAVKIKDLGKRLNIALARRVSELERYRSEFFGRLKQVLGENPYIRVEGDRFVFQAELLFASASAEIGENGRQHMAKLADTLRQVSRQIPSEINWILRIDGHSDRVPINNQQFPSNWELSTARALSVVKYLAELGIPPGRMAAAGFSKYHPLDPADTAEAYRKNRRIEIKLTSR